MISIAGSHLGSVATVTYPESCQEAHVDVGGQSLVWVTSQERRKLIHFNWGVVCWPGLVRRVAGSGSQVQEVGYIPVVTMNDVGRWKRNGGASMIC